MIDMILLTVFQSPVDPLLVSVRHSFVPLVKATIQRHKMSLATDKAAPSVQSADAGLPGVRQHLAELEQALVHCQQCIDLPQVVLDPPPEVEKYISMVCHYGLIYLGENVLEEGVVL